MNQLGSTSTFAVSCIVFEFCFLEYFSHYHFSIGQFWKAPELLRDPNTYGSQKADVYAFSIILYEVIGRKGPFGQIGYEPKEIVELVKQVPDTPEEAFRPDIECIMDSGNCPDYVINCIKECWDENPEVRPDFPTIRYITYNPSSLSYNSVYFSHTQGST